MAGLYIHIPFCKQACVYCNFHFSVALSGADAMTDALCSEIVLRKNYLANEPVETIYFGGGTPSLLPSTQIARILELIHAHFNVLPDAEITLEANPDDLVNGKTGELKLAGINRLSIGVQSFYDEDLQWMHRAHNAGQAKESIEDALSHGMLLTADLIFGSPITTDEMWQHNLETAHGLGLQHLSCYGLTLEERTSLQKMVNTGRALAPDEDKSLRQFKMAMEYLSANGWEQYEISNYCRNGAYARHNSNYWKGVSYLGIGPSAHSFNGISRSWNVSDNKQYVNNISEGSLPMETELLTAENRFNERLMTGLRTKWGVAIKDLENIKVPNSEFYQEICSLEEQNLITTTDNIILLTEAGKAVADSISAGLFL
ncbi:MAG: radical SAM family heme chaperone HemW [Bacteroidia bacterium]|nr:radical SAM family heme chaperone HemW [Bacteroidia bacterium]